MNARSDDPRVSEYQSKGYNLDEGMLFVFQGKVYHGSEAIQVLAMLSSPVSCFNRLNRAIFANRTASVLVYPFLKIGRRLTLLARGKGLIGQSKPISRTSDPRNKA